MAVQTILTGKFILAAILVVFVVIFGAGGGFITAFNLGEIVSKIPLWVWLILALIYGGVIAPAFVKIAICPPLLFS